MHKYIASSLVSFAVFTILLAAVFTMGGVSTVHADKLDGYDLNDSGWDYGYEDSGYTDYYENPGYTDYYENTDYTDYYENSGYTDYNEDAGYTDYYENPGYTDYYDYGSYDYSCGSLCGGSTYDYGCGSSCYNYTTPGCSFCGGSTPRYTPPVISQPAHSSSSYYSNTNTNVNNITNIDNSINDSFNNYNSNNTSLVVAIPQTPIVYTAPAAYCTINQAASNGYNNYGSQSYLSWTSTNATSAFLSNVGSVAANGSQVVYPQMTTTYTLTVYGQNGQSANCSTTVYANTYVPPVVNPPYVALTQIPYTGFDFGPIGNAIYWASLFSFAIAGAYLMIYFRGGAFAFAGNMVGMKRQQKILPAILAPKAPLLIEKEAQAEAHVAPVVAALRKAGTLDSMAIVTSKDGSMPKIVIERN
jgi:hypothetical protein